MFSSLVSVALSLLLERAIFCNGCGDVVAAIRFFSVVITVLTGVPSRSPSTPLHLIPSVLRACGAFVIRIQPVIGIQRLLRLLQPNNTGRVCIPPYRNSIRASLSLHHRKFLHDVSASFHNIPLTRVLVPGTLYNDPCYARSMRFALLSGFSPCMSDTPVRCVTTSIGIR